MIVFDQPQRCGNWAKQFIPHVSEWGAWYQAIGLERDGQLVASVVYNYYTGFNIAMHIAAIPGCRWLTKEYLKVAFRYPFEQLNVQRVTGYVPSTNLTARRFDEHLGFVEEGRMRQALPDDDLIVYGMLKTECRWLYGRRITKASPSYRNRQPAPGDWRPCPITELPAIAC
jgi:RimJ/RimL family protein N-acetyltransferase